MVSIPTRESGKDNARSIPNGSEESSVRHKRQWICIGNSTIVLLQQDTQVE